jgi:tripartite-type tricarboxylate transporter receptor subunit TctC
MHTHSTPPTVATRHAVATLPRRSVLQAASLPFFAGSAWAQEYPSKPIKIVVPFPAGGSSDAAGRMVADKLSQILKASVVVDNKGGAGGMIGTDYVAKAAPDGYTFALVDVFHTSTPIYTAKMPYDAVADFSPVALIGKTPAFLLTHPNFAAKTAQEVLRYGRANPDKLTMAIAGTGSVVVDLFKARSGLKFVSVPYPGSSRAMVDVMSGQVDTFITTMTSASSHVKSGKLVPLAVTGSKRHPDFPNVPTFAEAGVPGMDYEQWFGLLAPAKLPAPIAVRISAAMAEMFKLPDVKQRLDVLELVAGNGSTQEMKAQLEADYARWQKLAVELNIKPVN